MKLLIWITIFICTINLFVQNAAAEIVPPPKLQTGVFVYTIPDGFDPPYIGRNGLTEIQQSVAKLHYPFFVVLASKLDINDDDEDMARAIDGLAEDWQRQYPAIYKVGTSQIFLLSFVPRKYRFLGGATFKADLGFERTALQPYTSIFERFAKGTPKDPKTGILRMASAVDEYLFDQMDPARITARKEAQRKAEETKRLQTAQGALDSEIMRLVELLQDQRVLPPDANTYRRMLENARTIRLGNDPAIMNREAATIKPSIDVLEKFVDERRSELHMRLLGNVLLWIFSIVLIGIGIIVIRKRILRFDELKRSLHEATDEWMRKIKNASANYVRFYGERDRVIGLAGCEGETINLFNAVAKEIDAIYAIIEAMKERVEACVNHAKSGGFFSFNPFISARNDINASFEFDTGELNEADLFKPETKTITVDPRTFERELAKRYKTSIEGWTELKRAADMMFGLTEEHLPQTKLDELFARADEFKIPRRWLEAHPLYGDDASDRLYYDRMNEIRLHDPMTYMRKIEEVHHLETDLEAKINRLVEAIQLVHAKRISALPALSETKVDPADDPMITLDEARREEDKFAGRLASSDQIEDIESQAKKVNNLYEKCANQVATIQSAIANAMASFRTAREAERAAIQRRSIADQARAAAERVHKRCKASAFISAGDAYITQGRTVIESAERQLRNSNHLNARRNADEAANSFREADRKFEEAIKHCAALDKQKRDYEEKVASMNSRHDAAASTITRYGGTPGRLSHFQQPAVNEGLIDYALLYGMLATQENEWEAEERRARLTYEDAERRRREAEETKRQRKAAAEAEERRHRSSYSSSSSGGGWGGTTSSFGGDWGGGSSSAGGSW